MAEDMLTGRCHKAYYFSCARCVATFLAILTWRQIDFATATKLAREEGWSTRRDKWTCPACKGDKQEHV